MEIVLGAGSLAGDQMGALRDLIGIPDEFYHKVYEGLQEKASSFHYIPFFNNNFFQILGKFWSGARFAETQK